MLSDNLCMSVISLASFPGLPHFSLVLNENRRTKTGEAWEQGYHFTVCSEKDDFEEKQEIPVFRTVYAKSEPRRHY